jgi:hypothetical protein
VFCLRNSHKSEENDIERDAKFKVVTALTADYHCLEIYAVQFGRSFTTFRRIVLTPFWARYKREAARPNKTLITQRHIPEDGILHSHRRENLKSYKSILYST